jgi:Cu+-exporting ATPase
MEAPKNHQKYEFQVKGMTCVNCENHLKDEISEIRAVSNFVVSFLHEKIVVTITDENALDQIRNIIDASGFTLVGIKNITQSSNEALRILKLMINTQDKRVIETLKITLTECGLGNNYRIIKNLCIIEYPPSSIRAEHIIEKLRATTIAFKPQEHQFLKGNKAQVRMEYTSKDIMICLFGNMYIVFAVFILPSIVGSEFMLYPESFGTLSWFHIFNFVVNGVLMVLYGFSMIRRALQMYYKFSETNMITLVSLGILSSFGSSVSYLSLGLYYQHSDLAYFNEMKMHYVEHSSHMLQTCATIITSVVVGKYLESKAKVQINNEISNLRPRMDITTEEVLLFIPKNKDLDELETKKISPSLVEKGDLVKIERGLLCFDTIIVKGEAKVIDNVQFGRETIENKTVGDIIYSGCEIISSTNLILQVENSIEKSMLSKIYNEVVESSMRMGNPTKGKEGKVEVLTRSFVEIIVLIALLSFVVWWIIIEYLKMFPDLQWSFAFERALAVLVVSCPCALGMAIPIVNAISLNLALCNHILVKDGAFLTKINEIKTILFDKTGTVTGKFNIIHTERMVSAKLENYVFWEIIQLLENKYISHPIAHTLFQEASQQLQAFPAKIRGRNKIFVENDQELEYHPSEGIHCQNLMINNKEYNILLGNMKLLSRYHITKCDTYREEIYQTLSRTMSQKKLSNTSEIWLYINREPAFMLLIDTQNNIRPYTSQLIQTLKAMGKEMYLVTGDLQQTAISTARSIGIDESNVKYELEPAMKEALIMELKKENKKIMMIGDGINDLKAYQVADISVAINYKTSKNLSVANVIILNNDLRSLLTLFEVAKRAERFKMLSLTFSFCYNILAIPFAAGLFYFLLGYDLPPNLACWAMALSSLMVILLSYSMKLLSLKDKELSKKQDYQEVAKETTRHEDPSIFPEIDLELGTRSNNKTEIEKLSLIPGTK